MACEFPGINPDPVAWFRYVECVVVDTVVAFFRAVVFSVAAGFVQVAIWIREGFLFAINGFVAAIAGVGGLLTTFFDFAFHGFGIFAPLVIVVGVIFSVALAYLVLLLILFVAERAYELL